MAGGSLKHQTTTLQALMSLLKAYVGTGVLAMPKSFTDSGYVFGVFGTILIGILCNCCIHMLVQINELFVKPEEVSYDYEDLAIVAFENGPKRLRKYAGAAKKTLVMCLFLTQLGFCCAYCLFVAKNLLQFSINLKIGNFDKDDINIFLLIILPVMILLNYVKSIRHLSMGSAFANLIQLASLAIIVYNLVTDVPPITEREPFNYRIPQFLSTTMFTYEGITVTMPLYRSMKNRHNFSKPVGVLNMSIILVIIAYSSMGFLGYLKYGDNVAASITLSLPSLPMYQSVQLMYAIAITLSYPLQMFVAIQLGWPTVKDYFTSKKYSDTFVFYFEYLFRTLLVLFTFALAAFIPELDLVIELIGAFSCSAVAIIIPSILHLVTFTGRRQGLQKAWLYFRNLFILCLGLFGLVAGTFFSVQDIINQLGELYGSHQEDSTTNLTTTAIWNTTGYELYANLNTTGFP